jgi:hypothetical protein
MRKILERCPSCGGDLEITRVNCTSCETIVVARYQPCPFCRLSPESTRFLETFVKCRGNVKQMERELDISYWTVRRRLDDLILELGLEAEPIEEIDSSAEQRAILEQLNQGEITATQAAELLSQLKRPGYPA